MREELRSKPESATQEDLREHLRFLGWTDEQIAFAGVIPWQILLVTKRPLTEAEERHALTLSKRLEKDHPV